MITLRNILVAYGEKTVLRDVSLQIKSGDFVVLAGPNGSGKSTLLRLLAGQHAPSAGEALLDGNYYHNVSPRQRARRIAYFPQSRPTPNMNVQTLVSHGRFPHLGFGRVLTDSDRAAVAEALSQTQLADFGNRPLHTLSGGERQRAYLAMLIAQNADALLLDEPGAFLDVRHQLEIMDALREQNNFGKTIVFACHDLALAFSYAGRVLLLDGGGLAGDAPPQELCGSGLIETAFGVTVKPSGGETLLKYALYPAK